MRDSPPNKKPPGMSWQDFVEAKIREAQNDGAFENLSYFGKPLPPMDPHDEHWWLRKKAELEQINLLPPGLQLRRDVEVATARLNSIQDEGRLRTEVANINETIRQRSLLITWGPPAEVPLLDVEQIVAEWRARR